MSVPSIKKIQITKKNLVTLLIAAVSSALLLFLILSIFLPFAVYTKPLKLLVSIFGYLTFFFLIYAFLKPRESRVIRSLTEHWKSHILLSLLAAALVFYFTTSFLPLHPVQSDIIITTNTPLGFMTAIAVQENGVSQRIDEGYEFSGEWNSSDGVLVHQGSQTGVIKLQSTVFTVSQLSYSIFFVPQSQPGQASVSINGLVHDVEIPAAGEADASGRVDFQGIQTQSSSKFWQVWIAAYPFLRFTALFVYFFMASLMLRSHTTTANGLWYRYLLLLLLTFLFHNAILFQDRFVNVQTHRLTWAIISFIFVVLLPFLILRALQKNPKSKALFIILVLILGVGLRLYWVLMVPTAQISDFGDFHRWALQLASGTPGLYMDRHVTFTRLVGLIYKLMPNHVVMEMVNILASSLIILCLWLIGKHTNNEKAGILAGYLYAIFPSQIGMTSLVCNDIIAASLLLASCLFLVHYLNKDKVILWVLAAVILGCGIAIRSSLFIYSPALFVVPFVKHKIQLNWRQILSVIFPILGLIAGYLFINTLAQSISVADMRIDEKRTVIWPLMVGTNVEMLGRENPSDTGLVYSWPEDEAFSNGLKLVAERLVDHPLRFLDVLKHKYAFIFANTTFTADVAFLNEAYDPATFKTNWPYETAEIQKAFALLSQYTYWLILALASVFFYHYDEAEDHALSLLCLVVILSSIAAYTFFEVQPRYQVPIIPFIIIFASLTFSKLKNRALVRKP